MPVSTKQYKQFDWVFFRNQHSPAKTQLLWDLHDKKISELEFMQKMKAIKHLSIVTGKKRIRNYKPSTLRGHYHRLKTKFGFFQ